MIKKEIQEIITKAIDELKQNDLYLLDHDVHEQTITGKIACYISKIIEKDYNSNWSVDVEYNRNGDVPKSLLELGNVKPDILIHKRGLNNPKGNEENNLLIIEVKKNPSSEQREIDIKKISAFINDSPFYYKFGLFLEIIIDRYITTDIHTNWFYRKVNKNKVINHVAVLKNGGLYKNSRPNSISDLNI